MHEEGFDWEEEEVCEGDEWYRGDSYCCPRPGLKEESDHVFAYSFSCTTGIERDLMSMSRDAVKEGGGGDSDDEEQRCAGCHILG